MSCPIQVKSFLSFTLLVWWFVAFYQPLKVFIGGSAGTNTNGEEDPETPAAQIGNVRAAQNLDTK